MKAFIVALLAVVMAAAAFLWPRPAWATNIAYDQSAVAGSTSAASVTATLSTSGANEMAVAYCIVRGSTLQSGSISGGSGATWTSYAAHTLSPSSDDFEVWQGLLPSQLSSATITITPVATAAVACLIDTYKNASVTAPLEASHFADESSASGTLSDSVTTASANALVVSGAAEGIFNAALSTMGAGTGYTVTANEPITNGSGFGIQTTGEYASSVTATPGPTSYSWSVSANNFTGAIVGLSIAPAAAATSHKGLPMHGAG